MKKKTTNSVSAAFYIPIDRRRFFKSMMLASAGFTLPGYLAEALTYAPEVTQGPYYPLASNIPLDKDNDLIYLNDSLTRATGLVTYVSGRVLDASGNPVKGALVDRKHPDQLECASPHQYELGGAAFCALAGQFELLQQIHRH